MARRTGISLLAAVFTLAIAGCGSNSTDEIPATNANQLLGLLDSMQRSVDQGDCTHVTGTAQEFASQVSQLPSAVPDDVRTALSKQAQNLSRLAADPSQCTQTGTSGALGAQPTTSTTTSTTESVPTETTTTTTDESTTTTKPEHPAPQNNPNETPPNGNQGNGPPGGTPPGQSGGGSDSGGISPGGKEKTP